MIRLMAEKEEGKAELSSKEKLFSIMALEQPKEGKCSFCEKRRFYIGTLKTLKKNGSLRAKTVEE